MEPGDRIVRSDRRTLSIEIGPGGVMTVRAPRRMPMEQIERFLRERKKWIDSHRASPPEIPPLQAIPAERRDELKMLAGTKLPALLERWCPVVGVCPTGVRITSARTRYGSCSPKNGISFSCYLFAWPDEAVEYVVVHELCHIRHHDHSPAFYAAVERAMPDWRERRALLNKMPKNR